MAAGTAPALAPKNSAEKNGEPTLPSKPKSFIERLAQKLTEIFEHNEQNGVTRL
jgi:hypothetical protein